MPLHCPPQHRLLVGLIIYLLMSHLTRLMTYFRHCWATHLHHLLERLVCHQPTGYLFDHLLRPPAISHWSIPSIWSDAPEGGEGDVQSATRSLRTSPPSYPRPHRHTVRTSLSSQSSDSSAFRVDLLVGQFAVLQQQLARPANGAPLGGTEPTRGGIRHGVQLNVAPPPPLCLLRGGGMVIHSSSEEEPVPSSVLEQPQPQQPARPPSPPRGDIAAFCDALAQALVSLRSLILRRRLPPYGLPQSLPQQDLT